MKAKRALSSQHQRSQHQRVAGASSVPMTSDGIEAFADELHASATAMTEETDADPISQSWLGRWDAVVNTSPFSDGAGQPLGLLPLVNAIRAPQPVINPTTDFSRPNPFHSRMQKLWDDGQTRWHSANETRP